MRDHVSSIQIFLQLSIRSQIAHSIRRRYEVKKVIDGSYASMKRAQSKPCMEQVKENTALLQRKGIDLTIIYSVDESQSNIAAERDRQLIERPVLHYKSLITSACDSASIFFMTLIPRAVLSALAQISREILRRAVDQIENVLKGRVLVRCCVVKRARRSRVPLWVRFTEIKLLLIDLF